MLSKASQQEADPRLPQARSLRRYSELSVELMKDTHAPVDDEMKLRSASRRAGRPTGGSDRLARTELLSANLLSPYAAALARFYHAAGTSDRVRRQALKDKGGRHSTPISPAARWNQVRVCVRGGIGCKGNTGATDHQAAATRAAREAGWTLETHLHGGARVDDESTTDAGAAALSGARGDRKRGDETGRFPTASDAACP